MISLGLLIDELIVQKLNIKTGAYLFVMQKKGSPERKAFFN